MAIKLQSLYEAINNQFDVILHTNSFYDKRSNLDPYRRTG